MKIKQITETTTAGAIATTGTALGGTQSRGNPSIYGGKKVGSLFKGKKTSAPYANSINESAELSEAQLEEDDVIVVPGQGRGRKNGFIPHGKSRVDHEVEMARSDLFSAAKNAQQVYSMIKDVSEDEGLDGWVQEKIIKANDYLNTIREYLEGKQVQGVTEGEDGVDSLVTDTETVMRTFKMDALPALKIVLGEREYKDRPGFYNSFIRQIIARSKQQGVAEGSLEELSTGLLQRAAQVAKDKRNKAMDPKIHNALGGGYMNPLAKHYDTVSQKLSNKAAKAGQQDAIEKIASPAVMRKMGMSGKGATEGVAEGSRNAYLKHNNLVDIEKPLAGLKSEFEKFLQTHDPKEKQKYQQGIKQRIKSEPMSGPKGVLPEQGVAEGYDPVELDYGQWEDILHRGNPSGAYAFNLMRGDETTIRNILAYVKQNRAVLGKEVSPETGRTVKDAIMDIRKEFPQLYQAAQQPQGMAEGAKVDRMVKHVAQSEKKLGHSKKEAENIAWATANKRGMLDNKNKKA